MSFQIIRLSSVPRLSHLPRTIPPSITHEALAEYVALVKWSLASIIAADGATAAGLPNMEEVANDPSLCGTQTYLGHEALRQVRLTIREGGFRFTSSDANEGTAYIDTQALVPCLLKQLPEHSIRSVLLGELKTLAAEVERRKVNVTMHASSAALAA